MKQSMIEELEQYLPKENILEQEPMSRHTSFRVGGPARLFLEIRNIQELTQVIRILSEQKQVYYPIGNGSNLLVSDKGYDGIVLHLSKEFNQVTLLEECTEDNCCRLRCEAGASLAQIARTALAYELTGFEFAAGIPGSLAGAVVMNAGAYGSELKHVIESVKLLTPQGELIEKSCEEMHFAYRHSLLKEQQYFVVEAVIRLQKGQREQILARMEELAEKRRSKQPLEYPSAGSTFKRPGKEFYAAKLIEDAGLKGLSIGGAQVSDKHSGFLINKEQASAADIYQLMKKVQEAVEQQFGVALQAEVICLGEFV